MLKFFLCLIPFAVGQAWSAQDFDVWVETIPVAETRKYVKRVIQTYGIYHFLYDEKQPFIDLPDRVLR